MPAKVWLVKQIVAFVEAVLGDHIDRDCAEGVMEINGLTNGQLLGHEVTQLLRFALDYILKFEDHLAREELVERAASQFVDIVRAGCEGGIIQTERIVVSGVLGVLGAYMVDRFVICRVTEVNFIRRNSNDGACSRGSLN